MGGIEVAGLVLGAFPLLIHALEHYHRGTVVLKYHQILFKGNIERFLPPLVVDDDELKDPMADSGLEAWEDAELEERLKERLPNSYDLFLDIIGDINELMELLKKEIGVSNPQFQAKINETNASRKNLMSMLNLEFQAKRIRVSLKKYSPYKRLHEALSKASQCGCASQVANLQLQHRTSEK
ncbi:hypothetical protein K469DRAFT_728735 [Zopfia rhizophila CBS 207.26]|uniref:Prion-inhibition and propagation HeLo domain-containing protein n=1 Tax=Zopfia rhizophila CBS 207.26 TaxID=1314779 RepID=A0A6A6EMY6_9PEZI|nr:hypothetical protein K469DRAFT_728735 [Zopfia rhizophila CBS 207.26]